MPSQQEGAIRAPKTFVDAEDVTAEARKTFVELFQNSHLRKSLGLSRQPDQLSCDCREEIVDGANLACGDDSDCINRMTSIECSREALCGAQCRNRRFQQCDYAPVDVIRAGAKGYGLRALGAVAPGTFVYEYTGEVVDGREYEQRKIRYAEQGIQHFYFMQLQKGEFLDATMKGALARFANHSCNPNCSIEKWVVNGRLRMGLFAYRKILKGEEITFNYNADRYGSDPQKCHCGEPNCTGILGGRTQTAVSHPRLPQEYIEALDLSDKQRTAWVQRLSQARRTKLSEDDINAECAANLVAKPIDVDSVTRVMACLAQCEERWLVEKLVERIRATSETAPQARIMRMHGYEILGGILKEWAANEAIVAAILGTLDAWPRKTKNKIESANIEQVVQQQADSAADKAIRAMARKLLKDWSGLEMAYRIPRVKPASPPATPSDPQNLSTKEPPAAKTLSTKEQTMAKGKSKEPKKANGKPKEPEKANGKAKEPQRAAGKAEKEEKRPKLPRGWEGSSAPGGKTYYYNRRLGLTRWERPTVEDAKRLEEEHYKRKEEEEAKAAGDIRAQQLKRIIEQASMSESPSESPRVDKNKSPKSKSPSRDRSNSVSSHRTTESKTESKKEEIKFKETLAKHVPNWVKKYAQSMDVANQKLCSKEVIRILIDKERKHGRLEKHAEGLSQEKREKIKRFVKEYMGKAVTKYELKYGRKRQHEEDKTGTPKRVKSGPSVKAPSADTPASDTPAKTQNSPKADKAAKAPSADTPASGTPARTQNSPKADKAGEAETQRASEGPKTGKPVNGSANGATNGSTNVIAGPENGNGPTNVIAGPGNGNGPTTGSAKTAEIDFDDD